MRSRARAARAALLVPSLLLTAFVTAVGLASATPAAKPAPASTGAPPRVSSLANEPGYRPLVDPESASVALGRRLNAPLVKTPFTGGARGLDALGRAVCGGIHASSRDSLLRLCVTDREFKDVLWREFPQSRPATGVQWDDAWKILYARMHAGCSHAVRDYGGQRIDFVRFEVDSVQRFRNFRMYSGLTMVTRNDAGQEERMRWLRAVVERQGVYKIYSTED